MIRCLFLNQNRISKDIYVSKDLSICIIIKKYSKHQFKIVPFSKSLDSDYEKFYQKLDLSPSQQIVKIEKSKYEEEGIDCLKPKITKVLTKLKEPAISGIGKSFLNSETGQLIVISDQIYFYKIDDFLEEKVSVQTNLTNFVKGDSINNGNEKFVKSETNPRSAGHFVSKNFKIMTNQEFEVSNKDVMSSVYMVNPILLKNEDSVYNFFFIGRFLRIVNLDKNIDLSFDLKIYPNKNNSITVSNKFIIQRIIRILFYLLN